MTTLQISGHFAHAVNKALYEREFYEFAKAAWEHVDNAPYEDNWHVEAICLHLQAVVEGRINRLLINVPPGSAKSMLANVLFPAWSWTRFPKKRIINTSFSTDQSERDTVKSRRLITSEWYQSFWPIKLQDDQNQKGKYENTQGGAREVAPYSNMTGKRGNIVIVDDPLSVTSANSPAERRTANITFHSAVSSRLNDMQKDAIICIMQRVHEEDVAGTILAKNENYQPGQHGYYEHLCIPAEYDGNDRVTSIGWSDPRTKVGEPFFEKLFPNAVLNSQKENLGPIDYAGQYQQMPAPDGNGYLQKRWFHTYGLNPCSAEVNGEPCGAIHGKPHSLRYFITSDHAPAGSSTGDFNVVRVWGMDTSRNLWLVDSFRQQCTMEVAMGVRIEGGQTALAQVGALPFIKRYKPQAWFAENDNTWKAVRSQVQGWMVQFSTFCTIIPLPTVGSKMTKAQPYQALASLGKIYLPDGMIGEEALLEYMMFPNGKHDDQVDADGMLPRCISQAHPAITMMASAESRQAGDYHASNQFSDNLSSSDSFY